MLQLEESVVSRPAPARPQSLMLDNALTIALTPVQASDQDLDMDALFHDSDDNKTNNNLVPTPPRIRKKKRRAADIPVKRFDGRQPLS